MGSYKELKVYEKSYDVAKNIYKLAKARYPQEERYGMTSQVKRAATSIPLNIAEGYGKGSSDKELLRYLQMARGSCAEMEVLLCFSKDFSYITNVEYEEYSKEYEEIGKMLSGLIKSIENRTTNV